MAKKAHLYEGQNLRVTWDQERCIHMGACVQGLPTVFDPKKRPWIVPDAAEAEQLVEVIHECPTGALRYERLDGGASEAASPVNEVVIDPDGPLFVSGDIEILDNDRDLIGRETRVALCRCGASQIKPYCDGNHSEAGFEAAGGIPDPKVGERDTGSTTLRVVTAANGPLLLEGPMVLKEGGGADSCTGSRTALCRCGASENKPFCDGAHKAAGFSAS